MTNAGGLSGDFQANLTGNSDAGLTVSNLTVYNNVFYQDSGHNYPNIRIPSPCAWEGAVFKNNIIYNDGSTADTYESDVIHTSPPIFDYNIHFASKANFLNPENSATNWAGRPVGFETHGINTKPFFISMVTTDFHLLLASPAINAGTNVGLTTDYDDNPVPNGSAPDIGAYEYTASSPCNTVTPATWNSIPGGNAGYGAPYDFFNSNTSLLDATCSSADPHTVPITVGQVGSTTHAVYTKSYYYDPGISNWVELQTTCTGVQNGDWCNRPVTATITDPDISTATAPVYFVGIVCSVQGGGWKCGCRDTSCTNFYWQIQGAGL